MSAPVPADVSFAEAQLWQADQAGHLALPFVDCAPNLSIVVRLEHALNYEALEAGINEIVRRHDVLRSRFVATDGRPMRLCAPSMPISLTTVDTEPMPAEDQRDRAAHVLAEHVRQPFELTSGPLIRARLARLSSHEHILAITVHHIVFDRWSRRVFSLELKELY